MNSKRRVCIVTSGQPTTNPRVVKEADCLTEAGFEVTVIALQWTDWATNEDQALLSRRSWTCRYVGGDRYTETFYYHWTRIRQKWFKFLAKTLWKFSEKAALGLTRTLKEQCEAACTVPADLYIAHSIPSIRAAYLGAQKHKAKLGFSIEDFYRGQFKPGDLSSRKSVVQKIEERYIPQCDFLTVPSPLTAQAYKKLFPEKSFTTLLNVFPLSERPERLILNNPTAPLKLFWFSQCIGPERGIEDVVKAMGILPAQKAELHLLGFPIKGYPVELKKLARCSGADASRIFFHDPMGQGELARFSSRMDVGLALENGHHENSDIALSNKVFTYLLAGNAVIATSTLSQKPLVETLGEGGQLYTSGNIEELATKIRGWSEDRDTLNRARQINWDLATTVYNWDTEKKIFLKIVQNILN